MNEELYFCIHLTENEHWLLECDLLKQCRKWGCDLKYYRKLKDGHVPMYREAKLIGTKEQIGRMKGWLKRKKFTDHMEKNPYKVKE